MKRVIFIDRDGTINFDGGYTHRIEDYSLMPDAKKFLIKIFQVGYDIIILTNQSGIARGYYSKKSFEEFMSFMITDLNSYGIKIKAYYYCPHSRGDKCKCRKPGIKMFEDACKDCGPYNLNESWAIGDELKDVKAAKRFNKNIKTILLKGAVKRCNSSADYVVKNLLSAAELILAN